MKAITKEKNQSRPLASQPTSFRPYQDNYNEVMKLCETSGRKPAEELRDLLNEALKARQQSIEAQLTSQSSLNEIESFLSQILQASSEQSNLVLSLTRHLREQYGLLLEVLAGAYGARQIMWTFLAEASLREAGLTPEQIRLRFEEERRKWNAERDTTADLLEQAIQSLPQGQ